MLPPSIAQRGPALLVIDFVLTAVAVAAAFAWPRLANSWFTCIERPFTRLAQRKGLSAFLVGLSVIVMRLAILPLNPIPIPFVTDDFSFLLAADTFAHGRLTNPTPAMWMQLETIHVTMKPTYMSMYFPGESLILFAGKVLLGNPWFAVLLVSALMCGALCWMLQAWLPASWALLGGILAVLRIGVFSYWTNSYHSAGSLAALGGALILGALPRLMKTGKLNYGILIALGASILGLTRPYEGLLLCLPVGIMLIHWLLHDKKRPSAAVLMRHAVLPVAVLVTSVSWLGLYDYRVFGKATTLPYTVDRNTYAIAPYYVWQKQRPEPEYHNAAMRNFYEFENVYFKKIHSPRGFLPYTLMKVSFMFLFYTGFILLIPLLMVRRIFLDRRIRFLVICALVLAAGMVIEIFLLPHYVAPFTAVFYAIGLQSMRHLRVWKPEGKPTGLTLTRLIVTASLVLAGLGVVAEPLHIAPKDWNLTWYGPERFGEERAQVEAALQKLPGGQLAIVRYNGSHDASDQEWVYNWADVDNSKVVWARELDSADNRKLLQYYADRKAWLVEPDTNPVKVTPYPMPAQTEVATH